MLKTRFIVLSLLALTLMLTACGGGTSGLVDNDLTPGDSFKAVRYTDGGSINSALNDTVNLQTAVNGDLTMVTVSVNDTAAMWGVALAINYDANNYNPVNVEFNGLIDTPLFFSSTKVSGLIGASQVDINGTALRNGEFATITFRNEPSRGVSAAGDVIDDPLDFEYAPAALTAGIVGYEFDAGTLGYTIRSVFAQGDGNRDGFITAADITPIGQYWGEVMISDADFTPAIGDYSRDGMITASDMTPIGQRFNEQVTGFEFWAFDQADLADTGAMLGTAIAWGDGTMTARPTGAITDWGEVFAVWTGTVDDTDFPADTDADTFVYVTARAINGSGQGEFVTATPVAVLPPVGDFVIDDFVFQIENATGGSGATPDMFADGDAALIPANTDVTLNITEISGTFGGVNFVGDDGTATPAEYANAMANFVAGVTWTSTNAGDAGMQMTADVLALDAPTTGTGVTGTTFPDQDREATPEGLLAVAVAVNGTFIPAAFAWSVDIDVTLDPAVPLIVGIMTPFGTNVDGNHLVDPLVNSMLTYDFDWGTTVPVDMAAVGVTLFDLTGQTEVLEFTHTTELDPGVNEYIIRDNPNLLDSEKQVIANLGAGNLAAGSLYTVRIQINPFNSVNEPGEFLARDDYPAPVEMSTIPAPDAVIDDNDYLWIFYPEPKLRCNPRAIFNILDDTVVPEDEAAFNDIIKTTGSEFAWENAGLLFPRVVVRHDPDNNTDPSSIAVGDTPAPGVNQAYTCPGYIVMDILVLTTEGGPGQPAENYDYRVFGAGAPLGHGEFAVVKELMTPTDPVGTAFGVDIFDTDLFVATRDYTGKTVDATDVGSGNPPVLFVEMADGQIGDWADPQTDAVNMQFVLSGASGDTILMWDPRLAINGDGTMICVHAFTAMDFVNSGMPGWPGKMEVFENQTVQLADSAGIVKDTFVDPLIIVGSNPND